MNVSAMVKPVFDRWIKRRIPAQGVIELSQRSIFILPSKEGAVFCIGIVALFIGGVNYVNSLILALTFFLVALLLVVILHTFRNLSGLVLSSEPAEGGFVGDFAMYTIVLNTSRNYAHESIEVGFPDSDMQFCAVLPGQPAKVSLFVPARNRGIQRPGRIKVQTRYPMGLMVSWSWIDLNLWSYVYPQPVEGPEPSTSRPIDDNNHEREAGGADDFAGFRRYAEGDSLSRAYWKVLARGMPLVAKDFDQPAQQVGMLGYDAATGHMEERLQVLTYWVLLLSQEMTPFGLQLPGIQFDVHSGESHKQACLRALAVYGLEDSEVQGE